MPRNLYLDWTVPYAPGTLTAVGYRQGRAVVRYAVETSGAPAALRLTAEITHLKANGEEVAPVAVAVLDAEGRVVSDAHTPIQFSISGAGTVAGVANGNPASHELNVAARCEAFRGLCMVLVKATRHPGIITIQAQATGLKSATAIITTTVEGQ